MTKFIETATIAFVEYAPLWFMLSRNITELNEDAIDEFLDKIALGYTKRSIVLSKKPRAGVVLFMGTPMLWYVDSKHRLGEVSIVNKNTENEWEAILTHLEKDIKSGKRKVKAVKYGECN